MCAATQNSLMARKVRPSAVGVSTIPTDAAAMAVVCQLADEACEGADSGLGFYPGSSRTEAIVRYGLGLGPATTHGTAGCNQNCRISERFFQLANVHPMGKDRLRRAIWWAIVAHQARVRDWTREPNYVIGSNDPDFIRTCQVAAARMLSQGKLWDVVRRPDDKVGLARVDWPRSFLV